ncbi:MAG: RNA polymerase sigma-70 factor [Flavobacterium psychrophilum]|nr:MAG: RNA polymerase sigma-70 factor [Flavobacterium psychrophilum]
MKNSFLKLSDDELLRLVSKGNERAFGVIFDRYWKRLFNYAYKIYREEEICEDIIQEIFISLWNNSQKAVVLNLEAYLLKAVKYKIANHIRSLKFTKDHLDIIEGISIPQKSVNDLEYKEFETGIMQKIESLSPKCREVFILSRIEYLSNSEIATKLNLSIHTVEKHISNALKELRSGLSNWQYYAIVSSCLLKYAIL